MQKRTLESVHLHGRFFIGDRNSKLKETTVGSNDDG